MATEAASTERLAARRVVEAAGPAVLLEPAAPLGLEDAEEPASVARLGVVVTEGSVVPGSAVVAAPAARAWADQEPVAPQRPVTEELGAEEAPEAVERERAQGGPPAAVMVGQAAVAAREGAVAWPGLQLQDCTGLICGLNQQVVNVRSPALGTTQCACLPVPSAGQCTDCTCGDSLCVPYGGHCSGFTVGVGLMCSQNG